MFELERRRFLQILPALGAFAAGYPLSAQALPWQEQAPWPALAAVQAILFPPGPEQPGAGDIGALEYLHRTLTTPGADTRRKESIFQGVAWLDDLARSSHDKPFLELETKLREALLERIVESKAGRRWVSRLLTYLLEALLADPVYGGNPKGIGWKWLEHRPGYPVPPPDKTWYRLGEPVYFQRKA